MKNSPLTACAYDTNGILVKKFPIDGVIHKAVATSLRTRIWNNVHYSLQASRLWERLVYDSMRQKFNCPHMVNHVCTVVMPIQMPSHEYHI